MSGKFLSLRSVLDFDRRIQKPHDAFPADHGGLERIVSAAQVTDWIEESVDVQDESHQHPRSDGLTKNCCPAQPNHQAGGNCPKYIHARAEYRRDAGSGDRPLEVVAIDDNPGNVRSSAFCREKACTTRTPLTFSARTEFTHEMAARTLR